MDSNLEPIDKCLYQNDEIDLNLDLYSSPRAESKFKIFVTIPITVCDDSDKFKSFLNYGVYVLVLPKKSSPVGYNQASTF